MHEKDLTQLDLNLLVVFEAMLEERHVGRAANRMHLSQPATSHALGRLRRLFGDPLFVRNAAKMEPTSRARELAGPLAETLAQVRNMVSPIAEFDPATLARSYTVATDDYTMMVLLTKVIVLLRLQAPGVELRCVNLPYGDLTSSFDRGTIDLACGAFSGPPAQRVECIPLFEDRYVGVAKAGHKALSSGRCDLNAFVQCPHVLTSSDTEMTSAVDKVLKAFGLSRNIVLTVPSILSITSIVTTSDLISVMPARLAACLVDRGLIDVFDLPIAVDPIRCNLLISNRQQGAAAFHWILELAKRAAGTC